MQRNRREFLHDVGTGMLIAGMGAGLAGDMGISSAFANDDDGRLRFGKFDRLVGMMQDVPANKLQPKLIAMLKDGTTDSRELIAAAALANATTFGGQDYVGYHTEMSLVPALQMGSELPKKRQWLPILKVVYRNSNRIQDSGLSQKRRLKKIEAAQIPDGADEGQLLLKASRTANMDDAEAVFATAMQKGSLHAFNKMLWAIQDSSNVHRFGIAHRAWELIDVVGEEHAHTLLRQCIRFCVDSEPGVQNWLKRRGHTEHPMRSHLKRTVEQYKLLDRKLGTRRADDAWLLEMSEFVNAKTANEAVDAVAAAIKEGIAPDSIAEALSLSANLSVLRQDQLNKDSWRAHGATAGVHASDAANAWRGMIRIASDRNKVMGLLVNAYHTGNAKSHSEYEPLPHDADLAKIDAKDSAALLQSAESAIRKNDQRAAAAAIAVYGEQGHAARPVFDLMLKYAISEDGRLHAEKYYRTVVEEFATTSPTFRWRQLVSLARVTASAYGYSVNDKKGFRAGGYEAACKSLGVDV
ncbi:MAG: hypothetical protein CMJ78_07385 [Planctomycetaceae bacterium]|nr:hypothetical protein [Planctomycetaceae bacterium]